ncbi:MAG TPA: hypothetical protein VGJ94_05045 [Syntrophorhabdaceae bacterium]|jgi:cell division protein FtsL
MQPRSYVPLKRDVGYHRGINTTLIVVISFAVFIFGSLLMRGAFNDRREELIERLKKEREIARVNEKLKVELSGITRSRYIELKAKERLGLTRPKEEEVLVLRHE